MINRKNRRTNTKLVKLYLDYRQTFWSGFQPYYFFRKRIEYVVDNTNRRFIRSIFNNLLANNIIQRKVIYKKVLYLYNPANISHEVIFKKIRSINFK